MLPRSGSSFGAHISEFILLIATPQVIIMAEEYLDAMISMSVFRIKAQLDCPRCTSANVDKKFQHMGEFYCRHCKYFWKTA
jgi:transposase-like protein